MKVKSSVLSGLVLLVCLLGGLSLMSRLNSKQDVWQPADMYSTLGGSRGSSYSTVSYGSSAYTSADALVVPSSRSMFHHRAAFSYAHVPVAPAYGKSIASPASFSQGGLYTTSSAEFRSFGGGGNMGGTISGGSVKTAVSSVASASLTDVSSVAIPTLSYNTNSNLASVSGGDVLSVVSHEIAMASSMSSMSGSTGSSSMANDSYFTLAYATASYGGVGNTAGGSRRMGGRHEAPGNNSNPWLVWLSKYGHEYGTSYDNGDGSYSYGFDVYQLQNAYNAYVASGDWEGLWPAPPSFDDWLAWFMDSSFNYDGNSFHWVPVGDVWPMIILLLVYAIFQVLKMRKKTVNS